MVDLIQNVSDARVKIYDQIPRFAQSDLTYTGLVFTKHSHEHFPSILQDFLSFKKPKILIVEPNALSIWFNN